MNSRDHEPLTPEERAIAQRLSRLGGHVGPPPALDAAILAAARAATVQPASRRRHARWPVGVGIAASLAVAIGVAWQLRPLPQDEVMQASESATVDAPVAVVSAPAPAAAPGQADAAIVPEPTDEPLRAAEARTTEATPAVVATDDAEPPRAQARMRQAEAEPVPTPAPAPRAARNAEAAPVMFDAPEAMRAPPAPAAAPPPPPPPAPPAPPAQAASAPVTPVFVPAPQSEDAAMRAMPQARPASSAVPAPMRGQPLPDKSLDKILVTGTRVQRAEAATDDADAFQFDQAMDEAPPASFATPEARETWLQRIRELVHANDLDAARESLREFQRRYPGHVLPKDLKALLDE